MGRMLCLHGQGCSGMIFQTQLAAFRRQLGANHEYVYLDGEVPCDPAPGIDKIAPGPYLCYYENISIRAIREAHEQVLDFIEDEGPFDGVIGFSQGSALVASLILDQEIRRPNEAPLFNFAILFSGYIPFGPDKELYGDLIEEFLPGAASNPGKVAEESVSTSSAPAKKGSSNVDIPKDKLLEIAQDMTALVDAVNAMDDRDRDAMAPHEQDPQSDESCRPYHPDLIKERIWIPTVHVLGLADDYNMHARRLYNLCSDKTRKVIEHPGGHDVPRDTAGLNAAVKAAQDAIEKAKFVTSGIIRRS